MKNDHVHSYSRRSSSSIQILKHSRVTEDGRFVWWSKGTKLAEARMCHQTKSLDFSFFPRSFFFFSPLSIVLRFWPLAVSSLCPSHISIFMYFLLLTPFRVIFLVRPSLLSCFCFVASFFLFLSRKQMYMAAMQQNPAMMLMPYMAQYPLYARMALPTDVSPVVFLYVYVRVCTCMYVCACRDRFARVFLMLVSFGFDSVLFRSPVHVVNDIVVFTNRTRVFRCPGVLLDHHLRASFYFCTWRLFGSYMYDTETYVNVSSSVTSTSCHFKDIGVIAGKESSPSFQLGVMPDSQAQAIVDGVAVP